MKFQYLELYHYVIGFLIVGQVIAAKNGTAIQCSEKERERVDLQIAKIISMGKNGRPFPTNQSELDNFCRESVELIDKVEGYIAKCFNRETSNIAKVVFFSVKSIERKFCRRKLTSSGKRLKALIGVAPCINRHVRLNSTCIDNYIVHVEQIISLPKKYADKKFPYACCKYVDMLNCVSTLLDTKSCSRRNQGLIIDFVKGFVQPLVDVVCGEYNDQTDRCDTLPPMPKVKLPKSRKVYHSVMFGLIDLFESTLNV